MPETKDYKASSRALKQKVAEAEFGAAGLAEQKALMEKVFAMELVPPPPKRRRGGGRPGEPAPEDAMAPEVGGLSDLLESELQDMLPPGFYCCRDLNPAAMRWQAYTIRHGKREGMPCAFRSYGYRGSGIFLAQRCWAAYQDFGGPQIPSPRPESAGPS